MSSPIWSSTLENVNIASDVHFNSGFTIDYNTTKIRANVYTPTITFLHIYDNNTGSATVGTNPFSYYYANGIMTIGGSLNMTGNFEKEIAFLVSLPSGYSSPVTFQQFKPLLTTTPSDITLKLVYYMNPTNFEIVFAGSIGDPYRYIISGVFTFVVTIPTSIV